MGCGNNKIEDIRVFDGDGMEQTFPESKAADIYNNGGHYVKHGDYVYFRQYDIVDIKKRDKEDMRPLIEGAKSNMVRIGPNGDPEHLFADRGYGGIFIYENKNGEPIFILNKEDNSENAIGSEIYLRSYTGGQREVLGNGSILAVDQDRDLIIALGYYGSISIIGIEEKSSHNIVEADAIFTYYDHERGVVYARMNAYGSPTGELDYSGFDVVTGKEVFKTAISEKVIDGLMGFDEDSYLYYSFNKGYADEDYAYVWLYGIDGVSEPFYDRLWLKIDKKDGKYTVVEDDLWLRKGLIFKSYEEKERILLSDEEFDSGDYYMIAEDLTVKKVLAQEELYLSGEFWDEDYHAEITTLEYVDGAIFYSETMGPRNVEKDKNCYGYDHGGTYVYYKDSIDGEKHWLYEY